MTFKNKIALVTGGTKGLGLSISKTLLNKDAIVLVIYSSDEKAANSLYNSLNKAQQSRLFLFKGSVADAKFLNKTFTEIGQKFKKLDILINNAGINRDGLFIYMQKSDWQDVFNVNIKGTFLTSLFAKNLMTKQNGKKSFIVNISSISGVYGRSGQTNYATSKGAILGITRLFAKKYAALNINVNTLVPGLIETDMTKNIPEKIIKEITSATILDRMAKSSEITDAALFLCSPKSSYITSTALHVDGGFIK